MGFIGEERGRKRKERVRNERRNEKGGGGERDRRKSNATGLLCLYAW